MIELTAHEIAHATSGRVAAGDHDARITCVCTDTRAMKPNSLFIALKGDTFDGHDHIEKAIAGGAEIALVDRGDAIVLRHTNCVTKFSALRSSHYAIVLTDDTRLAMGRLAIYVRRKFGKTKVIAVAGSNGKTGTKHLIHSVLSTKLKGTMSPKSFNNDIGVPLTLFGVEPGDDFVVVEVGTNHPGEVKHLSEMCEPDIAAITSVGEEHLEFFKTLDGVRDENTQITAGMRHGGLVLVNGDDAGLRRRLPGAKTFGFDSANDLVASDIRTTLDGTRFVAATVVAAANFALPQIGRHNASNALIAIAVGRHFGLSDDDIRAGLAHATSPEMRMQKRAVGPITLINDAYNANPTSVRAALKTLDEIDWPGRKIVVLGEMRELGDQTPQAHQSVARLAVSLAPSRALFVGNAFKQSCDDISNNWFTDSVAASEPIARSLLANDLVLIKGSRSMKMEMIERAIEKRFA